MLEGVKKARWLWMLALAVGALALLLSLRSQIAPALETLEALVRQAGALGPFILVLATAAWITMLLPGPLILGLSSTIYAHDPVLAITISSLGIALAQGTAFLLARFSMRRAVLDKLGHQPWFSWLDRKVEEKGAKGVFVIRMLPVFPNTLANYGFGLTKIAFWPYLLASWAGSLPLIALMVLGTTGLIQVLKWE